MWNRFGVISLLALFACFGLELLWGRTPISSSKFSFVLLNIRLPRALLAASTGLGLSVSGAAFQCVFRNPLVGPYLLGVASGAAFGASLGFALGLKHEAVVLSAFALGLSAVALAYGLSKLSRLGDRLSLILAGVIVGSLFTALLAFVETLVNKERLAAIVFWTMGEFSLWSWRKILVSGVVSLGGLFLLWLMGFRLNLLSLSDEEARALGVKVSKERGAVIALASLVTSTLVAFVGVVSWVGLVIPHFARALVGPEHRRLIPASGVLGACFLLFSDALARAAGPGAELPISVATSALALPAFAALLAWRRGLGWS